MPKGIDNRNWNNLTQDERTEYLALQMTPTYGGYSAGLPDDCSECFFCSTPFLGSGSLCRNCLHRLIELDRKLRS